MITRREFGKLKEDTLRKDILVPLLQKKGFQDVRITHGGSGEQGKDIVCWKEGEWGERRNYALVVKAGRISGKAAVGRNTASEVFFQVQQCFGSPYLDPVTGEARNIHQCWVATNGEILKEARQSLESALTTIGRDRAVIFIDGESLWQDYQKHFPVQKVWQTLQDVLDAMPKDTHYEPRLHVGDTITEITLHEKFPGAAQEKPIKFRGVFAFPETPEGVARRKEFERHLATGSPVEIPSQFVQSFDVPEFLKELFGDRAFATPNISLKPGQDLRQVVVSVTFQAQGQQIYSLPYVELRVAQAGQEEITLSNAHQQLPVRMIVVLNAPAQKVHVTFKFQGAPLNVKPIYEWLRLRTRMEEEITISVMSLEMGLSFLNTQWPNVSPNFDAPDPEFLALLGDLVAVQEKTKTPITIPDRTITGEEMGTIKELSNILHRGKLTDTWESLVATGPLEGVQTVLDLFAAPVPKFLRIRSESSVELFGVQIPLGQVQVTYLDTVLANEADVRALFEQEQEKSMSVRVEFRPGENNKREWEYLDWLPTGNSIEEGDVGTTEHGVPANEEKAQDTA